MNFRESGSGEEGKIIFTIPRCCLQVHEYLVIRRFQVFVVVVVVVVVAKPVNLILWSGYLSEIPRITI